MRLATLASTVATLAALSWMVSFGLQPHSLYAQGRPSGISTEAQIQATNRDQQAHVSRGHAS